MRNCLKTIISISAVVSVLGLNSSVFGVATFARQTGLDCTSCHTSAGFPTLNTFGAAFKAGGYVNADDANLMGDGEALSIPKSLGMSIVTKVRFKKNMTDNAGASLSDGEANIPDELAIMLGGRVGKNVGYLIEWGGGGPGHARVPLVFDLGPAKLGAVVWVSDAMGPATVFETAATGAMRNLRVFENLKGAGQDYFKEGSGVITASSGVGLYAHHSMGFVAFTPFTNEDPTGSVNKPAYYVRAALTPNVAGLDLLVGYQMNTGTTGDINGDKAEYDNMAVDAQIVGTLGVPLVAFFQFASGGETNTGGGFGTRISAGLDAQIIENTANVGVGFISTTPDGADAQNTLILGGKYNIVRNLRLNVEYKKGLSVDHEASFVQAMLFGSW